MRADRVGARLPDAKHRRCPLPQRLTRGGIGWRDVLAWNGRAAPFPRGLEYRSKLLFGGRPDGVGVDFQFDDGSAGIRARGNLRAPGFIGLPFGKQQVRQINGA